MIEQFRMHPLKIISSIIGLFKDSFIFILLLFVFNSRDPSLLIKIGRFALLLYLIVRLILIIINWMKTTYEINNGLIQIKYGVFQKKQNSIPLHEIQNITWRTPFYYKWFSLTSLRLETSTTNDRATIQLEALKVDLAKQIEELATLKQEKVEPENEITSETNSNFIDKKSELAQPMSQNRTVHYTPSKKDVLKASFLSFSFLGLIPIIVIGYMQIEKFINIDKQVEGVFSVITSSWIFITLAIILLIIIAISFGVIQTYLKYGKYEISSNSERIFIISGILNEKTFSVQKKNVQAIRVSQSPLKKLLNFTDIKLISAGSDNEKSADVSSLYPFLPSGLSKELLDELLPQFPLKTAVSKLPKQSLYMRFMRIPWFWIIVTGLIIWFKRDWWFVSPILFIIIYLARFFTYRNTRFLWDDETIQFKTGGISTDIFITNRKKVIEVTTEQNIIQKRLGITTINTVNRVKPVHYEELQDVPANETESFIHWYKLRLDEIRVE